MEKLKVSEILSDLKDTGVTEVEIYRYNDRSHRKHGDFVKDTDFGMRDLEQLPADLELNCDYVLFDKEDYEHFTANSCVSVDEWWDDRTYIGMIFLQCGDHTIELCQQAQDTRRSIGECLRNEREFHNMTQDDVAAVTGIKRENISSVEKGKRNVTLSTLSRIAAAYDCYIDIKLKDYGA